MERDDERRAGERNRRESGIGGGVYGERGDFDGGEYGVGEQRDGGRGWKTANTLQVGDTFLTSDDRRVVLERIEDHNHYVAVYNLEVEADHTYFVGDPIGWGFDVWVHNTHVPQAGQGRPNPVTNTPKSAPHFKPDPKNNVTAKPKTVSEFLTDAQKFLGKGYTTGKDGACYSADGMRRVRFTPSDLKGHNGGPPHGHFEYNGGRNIHVPLIDL